jgi:uncharacterized protein
MARSLSIPLARLEPGDSHFEGDLEFEALDAASEKESFEVHVQARVDNRGAQVQIEGRVAGKAHSHCHRCLEPFDRKVEGRFDVILDRSGKDLGNDVIEVAEGLEEYDLAPLVREAMIVEEPITLHCREDCLGLCAQCGRNLNEGPCSCSKPTDPRWEALKDLGRKLDSGSGS